jgi:hypothetical protein
VSPIHRLSAVFLLGALLVPAGASAHLGGEPLIHVPLDHVAPGQSFPLIGADLGPETKVAFRISQGDRDISLGGIVAGSNGHFRTTLVVPRSFPNGYAKLSAAGSDGSEATTYILVGPRTESTPPPPQAVGKKWWKHPLVILLAVVVGGAAAALVVGRIQSARR